MTIRKQSTLPKEVWFLIIVGLMIVLGSYMLSNWKKIEAENNAFAKDCNDNRGGQAVFEDGVRQCVNQKVITIKPY